MALSASSCALAHRMSQTYLPESEKTVAVHLLKSCTKRYLLVFAQGETKIVRSFECCYSQNICSLIPNLCVKALISNVIVLGHWVGALMNVISALIRESTRDMFFFCQVSIQQKTSAYKPERRK
jgi:hypothetical protein